MLKHIRTKVTKPIEERLQDASSRFTEQGGISSPIISFEDDELFLAVSLAQGSLPSKLDSIRLQLECVNDRRRSARDRALAAIELGKNAAERQIPSAFEWFELALKLGSPVGAWELANIELASSQMTLEINTSSLPRLVKANKSAGMSGAGRIFVNQPVSDYWHWGIEIALNQSHEGFSAWQKEEIDAALNCLVCWLSVFPENDFGHGNKKIIEQRRHEMKWLFPLAQQLIEQANLSKPSVQWNSRRRKQLNAVHLLLAEDNPILSYPALAEPARRATETHDGQQVIVIKGKIAPASDKSEKDVLVHYEQLQEPVALTAMPDAARIETIRKTLLAEFPWAGEPVEVVCRALRARQRHGSVRLGLHPLLFVGPPGTGKTRFTQRLSELLDTPNLVINLAGMSDVKVLKGVTRGWGGNRPSRLVEFIMQTQVGNPLFILDEVDKASKSDLTSGGRPHDALLDLLEKGNAKRYSDIFLMTECDLSHCLYVATANSLKPLPEPLLSRFEPVYFPKPGPEHTEVLVRGIVRDMESDWAAPSGVAHVAPDFVEQLRGLGPRQIRQALNRYFGDQEKEPQYLRH